MDTVVEDKQQETPKDTEILKQLEGWKTPWDRFAYACFAPAFFWVPINSFISADFSKKTKRHLLPPTKGVCTEKTRRRMLV